MQDIVAVPALPDLRESVPDHMDVERYSDFVAKRSDDVFAKQVP